MSRIETLAEGVALYCADCREVLPTLGRVDAVVTDPPYGEGMARRGMLGTSRKAATQDYGKSDWDDRPPSPETFAMMMRTATWQIIFGGNYFPLPPTSCWLVWDKLNGDTFYADCELAWTNIPKAVRRIQWRWHGMSRAEVGGREHPTQKPREVMKWCIEQLPEPNRTILDPFMGSGTTGVAAVKLGRKFIGVEIEPRYFEIAIRRISESLRQPDLFIEKPKPPKQEAFL